MSWSVGLSLVRASSARVIALGLIAPSEPDHEQRLYDESDCTVAED